MVMNNLDGTTKTEMSFGTKNKNVHATIKFDADSFRVLNKDGSTASLHVAQGTDADSAVTMNYLENQLTRIESQQDKITSSDENNMVHYNDESGTLGVNNITADRIVGLQKNRVVITDENAQVTTSTVAKAQLLKLPNVPVDTNAELEKKADVDHSHLIADVEGLQDALDSKALSEHTHTIDDISGLDTLSVRNAEHAEEADSAKTDANGTPIGKYVRNVTISDNKITVTKGNGNIVTTEYIHNLVPATDTEDGKAGLVPAPCRADAGKFLSATGTWEKPAVSLADAGVTLTAEEINKIPEDIAAVDARVDEADQNLETAKADLEGKIDAQGSELHTAMGDLSTNVDTAVEDLNTKLEGKADAEHTHSIDDVTGLKQMTDDLVTADQEIKASIEELETTVAGKAEAVHTHEIADVNGLQDALDEKALADHDHTIDQISDIANAKVAKAEVAVQDTTGKNISDYVYRISADGANLTVTKGNGTSINVPISAEGTYSEFEGATDSENGTFGLVPAPKAGDQNKVLSGAGTWVDAPPADLEAAGITATAEELNYMTGVTSGVQAQLDGKAAAVHTHEASEITDFDAAVQSAVADDLAGKADAEHTHEMDDVTGLTDALGAKADAEHTHVAADITDLTDTLSSAVVGEAGKATSDKNGKDITTYVADVTSDDTKITVTKGDGSSSEIQFPEGTAYDAFTGASAEAAGEEGLVPAPAQGDQDKFLKADGTWAVPVDNDTTYDVATSETAGLVKASSEIQVDGEGVMTVSSIPQSKVTNLENTFATMSQASNKFEITDGLFEDTRVSYRDEEIRVMYSTLTPWAPQDEAEDPNTVTMALRAYAPAEATGYRIALEDEITEGEVTAFGDPDSLGRNYVETRLPVATYDAGDSAWTYLGSSSTAGKYVGWYVTVEWYNSGNKIIGSETVRVNLATESTFNSNIPGYMGDYAKSTDVTSALEGKADTEHTHVVADITDLNLSAASVAEATKATQDANGKAITEYVADVTLQESTIKIAKGDGSSSEIHLPEGTAYSNFTGTDGSEAGAAGLVPAPQTTDANKYLKSDGTWATIETGSTVGIATGETAGIVKASSEIAVAGDGVMSITVVDKSKVTGLDTALAAKADTEHTHEAADITDLQGLLDAKANATHTHATSDVTGLDTALAGKAASVHTHAIADVTDLETTLAGKVDTEDLSEATVKAATQDTNGKPITEYVAGVTLQGNTLKIAKGDSSTSDVELPEGTVYEDFTGASAEGAGEAGLVPAPAQGDQDKFLKADGTWGTPVDTNTTYDVATSETAGLVKPSSEIAVDGAGVMTVVGIAQDKVTGLTAALSGKANASHTHTLDDIPEITLDAEQINGLPTAVAGKAEVDHTHDIADITDLNTAKVAEATKVTNAMTVTFNGDSTPENTTTFDGSAAKTLDITLAKVGAAAATHTHEMSSVNGLSDALSGKANTTHSHAISDVTDLQTTLDGKAASEHTHEIADVTGLDTALAGKANSVHTHEMANVTGLSEALEAKADSEHTHTVSQITDIASATVAAAGKATNDKNDKDITSYVADVTFAENKITVKKGDSTSSEIELPKGTVYSNFTGASAEGAGAAGLVPAPAQGDQDKFLKADGTWAVVEAGSDVAVATQETAGIVKASSEIAVAGDGAMSITAVSQDKVTGLTDALGGKAATVHTHAISDVTDLQTTLDNKLEASDLVVATDSTPGLVKASTEVTVAVDGALGIGTIEQSKVTGLTAALGAKANTEHTHTVSDITDLNLSAASVAEATKATTDKNSKDITTYVADVKKSEDNKKIVITKGDSSSTEIELPEAATYSAFTGASAEDAGSAGLVPGPVAGDQDKFLKADGTWAVPVDTNTTYSPATTEVAGIVRASTEITVDGEGIMTVGSLAQSKVEGLTEALSVKANATHSHTASDISDLAEATVKAATQDTSGNALTSYVKSLSVSGSKLTVTKGDESSDELDLPSGGTGVSDPFTGTDGDNPGKAGLVPAPAAADADKFLASDGTWKVVQGAGGEVSIKYTSQVPTTAAVGGIEEGYIPPSSGIDILDLIYNLLHPYVAPELTATMLPRNGGTVGIATTQTITGVRVSLNKTGGNKIMSYQVYDVDSDFDSHVPLGELYSEDYENGFTTGAQTVSLNSPYQMTQASAHKYLTVRVMDLDGRETVVKTASFNFVETYYWGSAPGETVIDETFVNGDADKTTQASAKGTKVVSVNHPTTQFVYFCAPKSYGEITSVKDQNQFENIEGFKKYKTEVTINGRDYYVYHNDPFMGEMTFTFSY